MLQAYYLSQIQIIRYFHEAQDAVLIAEKN